MAKIIKMQGLKFPSHFTHQNQIWDLYHELKKTTPKLDIKARLEMIKNGWQIKKEKKEPKSILDFSNIKTKDLDYKEYLQTDNWKSIRKQIILEREKCELTGSKKELQLHHISYKILGKENQKEVQSEWLLLVSQKAHFEIHDNPLFSMIDPKKTKRPMKRTEFLFWFKNIKNLI